MNASHVLIACLISVFLTFTTAAQNSPAPRKLIEFVLTPDAADWTYKVNQNAAVQVSVFRYGVPWGYNDNTCPPTSVFAAVNTIKAPRTIVNTPITGRWRFEETNQESIDWMKKQLVK